jgi:hypothetical protein
MVAHGIFNILERCQTTPAAIAILRVMSHGADKHGRHATISALTFAQSLSFSEFVEGRSWYRDTRGGLTERLSEN